MKRQLKILTPNGILGYGIPEKDFWRGIDAGADAMIIDAGSTDPGPYLLGLDSTIVSREAYIRDLTIMLTATATRKVTVRKGKVKRVALKVRPKAKARVAKSKRLLFKERVRAGGAKATVYKRLKLIRR